MCVDQLLRACRDNVAEEKTRYQVIGRQLADLWIAGMSWGDISYRVDLPQTTAYDRARPFLKGRHRPVKAKVSASRS